MRNRSGYKAGRQPAGRRLLTASLAVLLVFGAPGGPQFVAAQAQSSELEQARERLATLFDPLEALRGEIDRRNFDLAALGLELAFEEAEGVVAYVHDAVRFESYKGLLRGAQGTLASGAGNALDQALLTVILLQDAGYEAEIRGGSLSDDQLKLVLQQLRPGANAQPILSVRTPPFVAEAELAQLQEEVDLELAALNGDVDRVDGLLEASAGSDAGAASAVEEAARDYYWVAYRMFEGDPWEEGHPVFGTTPTQMVGLEATQTFTSEIPPELQHRFSFQVFVERRLGDELVVQPVMEAWERPVANMYGVALTYANVPDGVEAVEDENDTRALMDATLFFYPMFQGDIAPGGMAFDMAGAVVPPDASGSPFAALFQTVAGSFGQALGALGNIGLDDSEQEPIDDVVSLTAQWLEFTLSAPGEEPVTHRRMVVDRLGAEARANGTVRLNPDVTELDAFAALGSVHTFMVDTGRYSEDYVLDRTLESIIATRSFVDEVLVCSLEGTRLPAENPDVSALEAAVAPLNLFAAFSDARMPDDVVSYRPAPALLVLSQRFDRTSDQIDLVTNPRWSLRVDAEGITFDAAANRRAGVWETRLEALPVSREAQPIIPAFKALESPGELDGLLVLDGSDPEAAFDLPLQYEAQAAIRDDLARNYLVVVPAGPQADDVRHVGWWRIDPVSGETLGRGGDGRGSMMVEYLTSLEVSLALTGGFLAFGFDNCLDEFSDNREAACCMLVNVAWAGVGAAASVGLAAYFGAAAALNIFIGMDVGFNLASLLIPSGCSGV